MPLSDADAAEIANDLWSIMNECEGHRFGQSGYDITLDHIYEVASVARDLALSGIGGEADG